MSETLKTLQTFSTACANLAISTSGTVKQLNELYSVVEQNLEGWLCTGRGQWPDKFTLLNRFVRTGLEPLFIIND